MTFNFEFPICIAVCIGVAAPPRGPGVLCGAERHLARLKKRP
jgi:hypothetical protein